jgi:hypothetical protein
MGWFSPLPRYAPHGTQTMPYGYGSKPTVPKWYPNGTQTSFVGVAGWLWKMFFFPQSYGKSIGNLTHPHIQSSVEAGAVVIVPVVQVFLDAIDLADQLKASDFQIIQTYYVNITRTFGYVWRNCLLVQMFN